jgi:outer membrane protein assembly factor BamB
MNRRLLGPAVLLGLTVPALAYADDWPQWQGPDRTNVSKETGLLKTWPAGGPKLLWTFENAGVGYSSPAVVGDRLYTLGQRGGQEFLFCLDVASGREAWATPVAQPYENGYGGGPRCTPTIDGDSIFAESPRGDVVCLDLKTGAKRWAESLTALGGKVPNWGYSESPLVDGQKLIVTPGGARGAMAALDRNSGKVLWRSAGMTADAAYSSPVVSEAGGVRQYVQLTAQGAFGVAAADGKVLWKENVAGNRVATIPTPIVRGENVYVTSDYGAGCALIRLTVEGGGVKSELVYSNKTMQNHQGGVVLVGDHLYGWSGNVNSRGKWVCQEFQTGKATWEEEERFGAGAITCAEGQIYCYSQKDGTVVRIDASPAGWKEAGRFQIPRQTRIPRGQGRIWARPVIANGRLYLRDQDLLFCYDLKDRSASR